MVIVAFPDDLEDVPTRLAGIEYYIDRGKTGVFNLLRMWARVPVHE